MDESVAVIDQPPILTPEYQLPPRHFTSYWSDYPIITGERDPRVLSAMEANARFVNDTHNSVIHRHFGGLRGNWALSYYLKLGQHNRLVGAHDDLLKISHLLSHRAELSGLREPEKQLEAASVYIDMSRLDEASHEERTHYREEASGYLMELMDAPALVWTDGLKLTAGILASDLAFDQIFDDLWSERIGVREFKEGYVLAQQESINRFLAAAKAFKAMPQTTFGQMEERYRVFGLMLEWAYIIDRRTLAYLRNGITDHRIRHSTLRQDSGHDGYSGMKNPGDINDNFDIIEETLDDEGQPNNQRLLQLKIKGGKSKPSRPPIKPYALHPDFRFWDVLNSIYAEGRMFPTPPANVIQTPLANAFVPIVQG